LVQSYRGNNIDKKSEFISKTAEIVAGVVVGFIAYSVSAPTSDLAGLFGIVMGLLTTLVVAQLVESHRHSQDIGKINLGLSRLLGKIEEKQQDVSDFAQVLRYGVATFSREKFIDVLLQLLWRIENSMLAANYIHPDEGWGRAYGELFNEIQRTKVKVNKATIRRVFIVDGEEEVDKLRSVMYQQKERGIRVKCIFKKKIENTTMLKAPVRGIETLDFDVIDLKYVWSTILDKNRKIKYGKVVFGKEECDRYKRFYDYLFEEAEDIE
jgi:hypothetical protein